MFMCQAAVCLKTTATFKILLDGGHIGNISSQNGCSESHAMHFVKRPQLWQVEMAFQSWPVDGTGFDAAAPIQNYGHADRWQRVESARWYTENLVQAGYLVRLVLNTTIRSG